MQKCVILFLLLISCELLAQTNNGFNNESGTISNVEDTESANRDLKYQVGIGDLLWIMVQSRIIYSSKYRMEFNVEVNDDGYIYLDLIGPVYANGKSLDELKKELTDSLKTIIRKPTVYIEIKEFRSQKVTVFGEAKNGIYPLKRPMRIAEFLSSIGGTTNRADLSNIKVVRAHGELIVVDLTKFINSRDQSHNIYLKGGDLILIPDTDQKKVLVLGEVKSPGTIYVKNHLNLVEAVVQAGGFTQQANLKEVKIIRFGGKSPNILTVNLAHMLSKKGKKSYASLQSGDVIFVPKKGDSFKSFNKLLSTIIPALQTILLIKALN